MSEPTEQQAGGFLTSKERGLLRVLSELLGHAAEGRRWIELPDMPETNRRYGQLCDAILARDAEVVCISRETMAVLRVWLDRFTDREAFPSGDPFYEATLALRGALEQTEASSE